MTGGRNLRKEYPHIPQPAWHAITARHSLMGAMLQTLDDIDAHQGRGGWIKCKDILYPVGGFWPTTLRALARYEACELYCDVHAARLTPMGRDLAEAVSRKDQTRRPHKTESEQIRDAIW